MRNKSRSLLTGFGVFWGVFMLISLLGSGGALREKLRSNFDGFATNTAMIFTSSTTKPYHGFQRGRSWQMDLNDVDRLRALIPELDVVTPMLFAGQKIAVRNDLTTTGVVRGVNPDYTRVAAPDLRYGRYINDIDVRDCRRVCVIGKKVYTELFPRGTDPCGQTIRVDSAYYKVVGVDFKGNGIDVGGKNEEMIVIPSTVLQTIYNIGNKVHLIGMTGKSGVSMSSLSDRMRTVIARRHHIDPTDESAITVFNTEVIFQMVGNLFLGVNILIWLVGLGTLLAGAVGVSNIMMVTVRERTTEIGIRRAIGATPRMILTQVVAESILLTAIAGALGIIAAVGLMELLEANNTHDGVVAIHFQVDFTIALLSTLIITLLGGLAGIAPAWRAMSIKPIDALNEN